MVDLDGDLYTLRIPRIFGTVEFVVAREFLPRADISRGPAICNVAQLVENLSSSKSQRLSEGALTNIAQGFERGFPALYALENTPIELMQIALGDVAVAVDHLMSRRGRFGESKWASLQAAEKTLKAAISLAGADFKRTHGLETLFRELGAAGVHVQPDRYVDAIQCKPAIRYGEEKCSEREALVAHQRSLELVNAVSVAGAKFEMGIGGFG